MENLIMALGRALAALREAGHPQHVLQQLEDDITGLDAVIVRDAGEAEQRAVRLVARLYGIVHPPIAEVAAAEPAPAAQPAAVQDDKAAERARLQAQLAELDGPDAHMAAPAEAAQAAPDGG